MNSSVHYQRLLESTRPRVQMCDPNTLTALEGHSLKGVAMNLVDSIAESLKEDGWQQGVIVTVGADNAILDGRHRAVAAASLGMDVPVVNISEQEYQALAMSMPPKSLEDIAEWARRRV